MTDLILVVDSSIIIKWLSADNEKYLDVADKILKDAQNEDVMLIAPELAKYEVGNVLLFSKHLASDEGTTALAHFYLLPNNMVLFW